MSRHICLLILSAALSLTACAQAPIDRQPPALAPPPLSVWPRPGDLHPGELLIVSTFEGSYNPCRLRNLEPYRLICLGIKNRAIEVFDRERISSIAIAPRGYTAAKIIESAALGGGLTSVSLSLFCGVDGGPVCKTPGIVGLSLLATGGVLHIVTAHRQHNPPKIIYFAAPPPPLPDPSTP